MVRTFFRLLVFMVFAGPLGAQNYAPSSPEAISVFQENGQYIFRTLSGMDLYIYDQSEAQNHNFKCAGLCQKLWQPLSAPFGAASVGDWQLCSEKQGVKRQWCYKGQRVYTFKKDKPGRALGHNKDGHWTRLLP